MKQTTPNTQYRPHAYIDYFDYVSSQVFNYCYRRMQRRLKMKCRKTTNLELNLETEAAKSTLQLKRDARISKILNMNQNRNNLTNLLLWDRFLFLILPFLHLFLLISKLSTLPNHVSYQWFKHSIV